MSYAISEETYDIVGFYPIVAYRTLRYSIRHRSFRKTSPTIFEGHVGIIRRRRLLYVGVGYIGKNIRLTPTLFVLTSYAI